MKTSTRKKVLLSLYDLIVYRFILFCFMIFGKFRYRTINGLQILSKDDPLKYRGINAYLSLVDKDKFFLDHVAKHITAVVILPNQYSLKEKPYSRKYVVVNETSANHYYPIIAIILMLYRNKVGDAVFNETLGKLEKFYGEELNTLIDYFRKNLSKGCFPDY